MASNEQGPGNILTAVDDGILHVEIKRPEKKNALTGAMYQALADAIDLAAQSAQIRVILLHGQPDVFTSGNDLKDFLQDPALDDEHVAYRFVRAISRATKPIVAAVNGACVGVGATLLLHCDLVYAGQGATFALPFVNLGLCPEAGSSLLLPLVAGRARAAELLLLGEPFSAARAEACGMISAVLPDGDVLPHAHAQARKLAAKPPAALRASKALMRGGIASQVEEAIRTESHEFQRRLQSPEAKEAFAAFLAKRAPDFSRFA
ncbi:MAG: enoyl-CoA hydratase [Burkholderiales bacterium]|nr:enoyl-CoA hydratase [Burkholderiales bacterium]